MKSGVALFSGEGIKAYSFPREGRYINSAKKIAGNAPDLIWCDYLIIIQT
jgi:hypothetical protein